MVRISDILKKARKEEQNKRLSPAVTQPQQALYSPKEEIKQQESENKIAEVRISSSIVRMTNGDDSVKLYEDALSVITAIFKADLKGDTIDVQGVLTQVEKIVDQLLLGNDNLLILAFTRDSNASNYLCCHSLNVCVYSIELGVGLGLDKDKLLLLGVSAFLHDIGMSAYLSIVHQPRRLTRSEFEQIKNHASEGAQLLDKIISFSKMPGLVAFQHHERVDGSGYYAHIKNDSINDFAKIISLADVYEAMTHVRLYRDRHSALETVQEVLNNKEKYDQKLIKILIDRIGIFPAGCVVKLSNKEIAQVIKINKGVPLRPTVKIILDAEGNDPREQKIIDLIQYPTIYIKSEVKIV